MKRVIVAGGRYFNNYALLERKLDAIFLRSNPAEIVIVSGCCSGADRMGEQYAKSRGMHLALFPAQWETFGREKAGYLRNKLMADYADYLVAFWDGKSRGTRMMIELMGEAATARGQEPDKVIRVIRY